MRQPTTSRRNVQATQRRHYVLALRKAGVPYAQIARAVHQRFAGDVGPRYDGRDACKDAHFLMTQLQAESAEVAAQVKAMELQRLDDMQMAVWPAARGGDCQAIGAVLRIMERRSRLMHLDAPMQVAPTSPAGTSATPCAALTVEMLAAMVALAQVQPEAPHEE